MGPPPQMGVPTTSKGQHCCALVSHKHCNRFFSQRYYFKYKIVHNCYCNSLVLNVQHTAQNATLNQCKDTRVAAVHNSLHNNLHVAHYNLYFAHYNLYFAHYSAQHFVESLDTGNDIALVAGFAIKTSQELQMLSHATLY